MADPFYGSEALGVASRVRETLARWLFPVACLGCGRQLAGREPLHLCIACRARLRPAGPIGPLAAPTDLRILSLWRYEPPLDAVILALKFRRLDYLGRHLARELAAGLGRELREADLVVPVPLHWTRRVARGFDQAERIAVPLAEGLRLPVVRALTRRWATRAQTRLGRTARRANLAGAFRIGDSRAVAGRRILLVDDVTTTGATLEAAAAVLRAAGAAEVLGLTAARTPL
ncbi:MAG TPA: phosphoribosyltransferase family protein [Thermoanaerobaculia bacterium]|nr:phosphoribosyltransferase family protein [Thermoanaerobaculia bacterium]